MLVLYPLRFSLSIGNEEKVDNFFKIWYHFFVVYKRNRRFFLYNKTMGLQVSPIKT